MPARRNWSYDETLKALALYFILPSAQHHKLNPDVIALADKLDRTPSSVALKLANIKANDPMRRGKGLTHGSKLDALVWEEYQERGDALAQHAAELLLGEFNTEEPKGVAIEYLGDSLPTGEDRKVVTTARVNQSYFRNALLENYDRRCCITNLGVEPLLVASHIKPWSDADPATERLSPENGLLLNALHDRAFDQGLMTIDQDLRIVLSTQLPKGEFEQRFFWRYKGERIQTPGKFRPRREFIEYHNDVVFRG